MTKTNKYLLIALLAAIAALFLTNEARLSQISKTESAQARYDLLTQSFDSLKNKYGVVVIQQVTAQTASKQEIKELSAQVFDLKKKDEKRVKQVNALIRIAQEAGIDSVLIPYAVHDTVEAKDSATYHDWVKVPKTVEIVNDSLTFKGTVLKEGFKINTLSIPDSISIRIAENKKGLFSPRQTVVQIIHSSPIVQTTGVSSLTLKQRPSLWNRVLKPVIAVGAGLFLGHQLAK